MNLEFVRITSPEAFSLIPRYLFEQIPDRQWEIEDLYIWGVQFIKSPLNLMWVLVDRKETDTNPIKGFLWATVDPVLKMIAVNILSVDKEYQSRGKPIKEAIEFLKNFRKSVKDIAGVELKGKMLWTTTRPRAFERLGVKRFNRTIMEVSLC